MDNKLLAIFEDVDLITKADAIRHRLSMSSGTIPRLNEDPSYFTGGTQQGLALIVSYGHPQAICTPFGNWGLSGGGALSNVDWLADAEVKFGLKLLVPEFNTSEGSYGPVYSLSRDIEGNELPETLWVNAGNSNTTVASLPLLNKRNVTQEELNFETIKNLRELQPHNGSLFDYGANTKPDVSFDTWLQSYHWFMKTKWALMKLKIGFISWDDRPDPHFYFRRTYSDKEKFSLTGSTKSSEHAYTVFNNAHTLVYVVLATHKHIIKIRDATGNELDLEFTHI